MWKCLDIKPHKSRVNTKNIKNPLYMSPKSLVKTKQLRLRHSSCSSTPGSAMLFATRIINPLPRLAFTPRLSLFLCQF